MSLPAVPPFGPTLSSYLYFMLGPACLEAASHITALSCQQWNSCGWRPQEGSVETGAEEAWLTDWSLSGYAESHRGDESRAFLFNNNPSLVPDNSPPPPPTLSSYISFTSLRPLPTVLTPVAFFRDFTFLEMWCLVQSALLSSSTLMLTSTLDP